MITIKVNVKGCEIEVSQPTVASGTAGRVQMHFCFDNEWNGLAKTAVFHMPYGDVLVPIFDNTCDVPAEVIAKSGKANFGVFGTDGENTLTTVFRGADVQHGVPTSGTDAANYTPGLYEQFAAKFARFENISATATAGEEAKATFSEVDGKATLSFVLPRGEKGDKGADGYTPQKGVDYFDGADGKDGADYVLTDADKEVIADDAAESVVNDYAIRETIYIGLDGYCYSADGIAYSINKLDIFGADDLKKYNFVLLWDDGFDIFSNIPLSVTYSGTGQISFSAISYSTFEYLTIYGSFDGMNDAIVFATVKMNGEYLNDTSGVLSVDKEALLGDVESALDSIIAIQNSLIGGEGE